MVLKKKKTESQMRPLKDHFSGTLEEKKVFYLYFDIHEYTPVSHLKIIYYFLNLHLVVPKLVESFWSKFSCVLSLITYFIVNYSPTLHF